jgi:glycerol-3-phosphate acyltransferase PlsX
MLKIAIDLMGGDNGVEPIIQGVVEALKKRNFKAVLIGDENLSAPFLKKVNKKYLSNIEFIHTSEYVNMSDNATSSLKNKESSIYKAIDSHKEDLVQGVVSAGHSGATMSLATLNLGRIKGVARPAIAAIMPNTSSLGQTLVLDVGANVDCKSDYLYQFFFMGKAYAKNILGIENPRVGLLSNGEEESKGNELTKETFTKLKDEPCFIGNIEGNNIFDGSVDVIVCDGFTGNLVLKASEGVASAIKVLVKKELKSSSLITKSAAFMLKRMAKLIAKKVDYAEYGGAPLMGVNGCVIIAHGKSNAKAIKNAIFQSIEYANSSINDDLVNDFKK